MEKRYPRPLCQVEGCTNLARKHRKSFRKYCARHYCEKYGISLSNSKMRKKEKIDNSKCSLCGWVGPCHRHRKTLGVYGGEYTQENVISVCPNCHCLIHKRILKNLDNIEKKVYYKGRQR